MSAARDALERIARAPDASIDPIEAALWIAAEEYPALQVADYLARLDALADGAAHQLATARDLSGRVTALNRFLFEEQRFAGDTRRYYDPRNSYLNEVLDRRLGIPITLALVYMGVGRRLDVDVQGISFPGHFLVKCVADDEIVIDPYAGVILSPESCQERLRAAVGAEARLTAETLRAATAREILVRMLSNLKQIFVKQSDLERALACCERILLLVPDSPRELRDRAAVYAELGYLAAAAADLDRLAEVAPTDPYAAVARRQRDTLRRRLGRLH